MQLGRGAVEDHLAIGQHQLAIAVALGLAEVVGRVDHRRAGAGEPVHELPEALALARVEPGRRLVEQQHGGRREQSDRDVHPLLVATREGRDLVVATLGEAGLLEHRRDRAVEVGDLLQAGEQAQVLRHGEAPVQRRRLRDPAHLPRHRDRSLVGLADPGEDRQERRLAGPLGPITASSSPGLASNETPRRASRSPKRLVSSRTEITGAPFCARPSAACSCPLTGGTLREAGYRRRG